MKYLLMLALMAPGFAFGVECYTDEGHAIEIPADRRVILIPSHWKIDEVYRESHRAEELPHVEPQEEPQVVEPPERNCLVLGPGGPCVTW